MMGEMTDYSNMAQAFAYIPVVWSVGATIGCLYIFLTPLISNTNCINTLVHSLVGNFPVRRTVFRFCLVQISGRCILKIGRAHV